MDTTFEIKCSKVQDDLYRWVCPVCLHVQHGHVLKPGRVWCKSCSQGFEVLISSRKTKLEMINDVEP